MQIRDLALVTESLVMIRAADQIKPSGTPTPVTQRMTRGVLAPADGLLASNLDAGGFFCLTTKHIKAHGFILITEINRLI